jgi:hypothetical protein
MPVGAARAGFGILFRVEEDEGANGRQECAAKKDSAHEDEDELSARYLQGREMGLRTPPQSRASTKIDVGQRVGILGPRGAAMTEIGDAVAKNAISG